MDFIELYAAEGRGDVRAHAVVALGFVGEKRDVPVLRRISMDFNYLCVFQRMPAIELILRLF